MSVAARSIRFPHNMALAGDLHEDFNALGIRCRSTSCSAPEMNCPSMTFSTSSSETTTTETENETPPLSPSESATQSTPKLKFAFDLDGDLEGFGEDFQTPKVQRKAYASRNGHGHGRLAFESEAEEWDGYEAESEGRRSLEKKAPVPVIGSPREHKFGAKKTRDRVREVMQQQLAGESQDPVSATPYAMLSSNGALPVSRKAMRCRKRKPSGLCIMIPSEDVSRTLDTGTTTTPVANRGPGNKRSAKRVPARVKDGEVHSPLLKVGQAMSSSATSDMITTRPHHVPHTEFQTPRLRPHICDNEPSPIEALPSPLLLQGDYSYSACTPL